MSSQDDQHTLEPSGIRLRPEWAGPRVPAAPQPVMAATGAADTGPDVLGLLLTTKCNIACRHCCNDSHPSHHGAAPFEDIAKAIRMAMAVPSIREIGLSGGEPFLFLPLLRRVIAFARECGFSASVTTNGFWGRAPRARRMLDELAAEGLHAIHVSTSAFHREFVAAETVTSAARVALDAGLHVTLNLVASASLSRRMLEEDLGSLAAEVDIVVMPCLPAGRGRTSVAPDEFPLAAAAPRGNCREHFRKLAVDTEGNVYPCCSPGGFTPSLRMGNLRDAPLEAIVAGASRSKLLAILDAVGPQFFLPFLRAAAGAPPLPVAFGDQCHLCHAMLSTEAHASTVELACEQLFAELRELAPEEMPAPGDRIARLAAELRPGMPHATPVAAGS